MELLYIFCLPKFLYDKKSLHPKDTIHHPFGNRYAFKLIYIRFMIKLLSNNKLILLCNIIAFDSS